MVSTRLQTGAINTQKYTPLSISVQGLSLSSNPSTPTRSNNRKNGTNSPTRIIKPISPRASGRRSSLRPATLTNRKTTNSAARLTNAEMDSLDASLRRHALKATGSPMPSATEPTKPSMPADMCPGNAVFPSASFGAREDVGLSKIGRAEKNIKLWEEILITHQENVPALVPQVEERLKEARAKRAELEDSLEENTRVGDIDPIASAIRKRLEILQWGLDTSKFGPESENIKCAMAGYKSGEIKFSTHFTLIYAGKIVDTATTYQSFVNDRTERLDRYFALHGEGWLWYEQPLNVHPSKKPTALATATMDRALHWSALGCYNSLQGFWKRSGFVRRMAATAGAGQAADEALFNRDPNDPTRVDCQQDGPRLSFWSLLDSGATFPTLHTEDMLQLGIDKVNYSAQCLDQAQTANGLVNVRIWELFVCVLDKDGRQLVNPSNAMYPNNHLYLGGLCPCIESTNDMAYNEFGIEIPNRLSGMLPFSACYMSVTPTRDFLFMGEDRNDVLGSHRMPGQKKWSIEIPAMQPGMPFDRYDNPKVQFDHRRGQITDIDHPTIPNCSQITFLKGQPQELVIISDPGKRLPPGLPFLGMTPTPPANPGNMFANLAGGSGM